VPALKGLTNLSGLFYAYSLLSDNF